MNEKSDFFLKEFLKPVRETDDNLSVRLSILFILKQIAPEKFKELNLDQYLETVISKILERVEKPISLLESITSKIKLTVAKKASLYGLQPKLDYWYYTKLLGHKDKYKADHELIRKIIPDAKIKNVTNSTDAVLFYIYVRTLLFCDLEEYGRFNRYIPILRKEAIKDADLYAYFLTHVILYDTNFGQKKAPKSSFKALKELEDFCKDNLKFERQYVDLMSEIIICCKLCEAYAFPFYAELVKNIMTTETFQHYHENAVLAAATFE